MAEPRKVQFVTLSAFAAGAAADSRKRRLEDDAEFNLVGAGEEEAEPGAGGAGGREQAAAESRATVRLSLSLSEPDDRSSSEYNYGELIQSLQAKNNLPSLTAAHDPCDPFNDEEKERLKVEALAKKFENKYGNTGKKKDRMQDLVDIGFGYDETDPFIDNSEAYDELVPASLTTKLGGFYINTGTLQFRAASDSEGEEDKADGIEMAVKKRKKKDDNNLEEKNQTNNSVAKQGVTALHPHRPEKKKRKKLMKDSLYLAAMLRRFTREKEEMRKTNPSTAQPSLAGATANKTHAGNTANHLLASNSAHPQGNVGGNDLSLAELTSDPAVMSLLGSANEKELQDLLGDLDFTMFDTDQQHAMVSARENGILGVGVPAPKAAVGGSGQGRGLLSPPPLPEGLPAPLIKRIEDLRAASRQFDQEGRKKFFTLDMNNILLDIELQVQEQPPKVRTDIYSHMEAFVPCNKEALLKRLKKLSLNIQDDRLRAPLLELKLAVCSVMPEQIAKYNMDCMAKVAKQQSEDGDRNGSEEEDEEKPGKRVMGPRKKFVWDDKLRNLLCSLVRVKLSCYEMENQCSLSVEDYLKAFLENEVKPLWPKGWMQTRILFKESLIVHNHLTGNLVKRRMIPAPKAKPKEGLWIQKQQQLSGTSPSSLPTCTSALTSSRLLPSSSLSEPICLSDSLDEDLTAPSLDSISHALALLSNATKGICSSDSPLSPPMQIPTSSPPPIAPHYPSASQLAVSVASTRHQHSVFKMENSPLTATTVRNLTTTITLPTSSTSTSALTVSSMSRVQTAGPSPAPRTVDAHYGLIKGSGTITQTQTQTQRLVTMSTPSPRSSLVMGKMYPPSSSPPKQRPPPTASPLLPPHQKGFASPAAMLGVMGASGGLTKNSTKPNGNAPASSTVSPQARPASSTVSPQARPASSTVSPQVRTASSTPSPQVRTASSTPSPQVRTASSTPSPQVRTASSTPSPQVRPASSTPSPQVRTASSTPSPQVRTASSTPSPQVRTASSIPSPQLRTASCTPSLQVRTASSTPSPQTRPASSNPSPQTRPASHLGLQTFCPPSPVASSASPHSAHTSLSSQGKAHTHHHTQSNFITPMQATLTKSSHSSNSSPIIKLTPRPPAPTPPPASSPSPSSSPSHALPHQMAPGQPQPHQFSTKTSKSFRPSLSVAGGGGQVKPSAGSCTFTVSQKPQSNSSTAPSNNKALSTPQSASVAANHGQRQRVVGGANQGLKAGNGWAPSGTLVTSSTTSHLPQVSTASSALLGTPPPLSLGFGMLGGLVPVSLPFPFPPLLNFPPGAPAAAGIGSAPSANSGYPLTQSDLIDLYKSLQSGQQAALPPHLQLAFTDLTQSPAGDMKRKTH